METRRILVLCRHLLFAQALRTLLSGEEEFDVVGVETDEPRAMEAIRLLKPEIVVVETGAEGVLPGSILPYLSRESPGSMMIGLSLTENEISVYHGRQRRVRKAEDLLEVIRGL
ncbi:MAG: hypothetical protein ACE5LG_00490 [Anaerolineae bacterium]